MEMLNLMLRQLPSATHSKESNKQCFFFAKSQTIGLGQEKKKGVIVIMSTRHCLGQKWRFMITKDFNFIP